jgi:hypothetical protein
MVYGWGCGVVGKFNLLMTSVEIRFFWIPLSTMKCSGVPFTHICEWKRHSPSSGSSDSFGWIFVVAMVALGSLMNLFPSENTQKTKFWRRALPYTSSGSAGAPPYTVWEHYKAPLALLGSTGVFRSVGAPLKPTGECYSALMALLRERCLFWAVVKLLR